MRCEALLHVHFGIKDIEALPESKMLEMIAKAVWIEEYRAKQMATELYKILSKFI